MTRGPNISNCPATSEKLQQKKEKLVSHHDNRLVSCSAEVPFRSAATFKLSHALKQEITHITHVLMKFKVAREAEEHPQPPSTELTRLSPEQTHRICFKPPSCQVI